MSSGVAMAKDRNSSALAEIAERLHEFDGEPLRVAFLARGIDALTQIAERLDQSELGEVVASPSNADALVTALSQPSAVGLFSAADPLTPARLRGLQARDALLAAEGGTLTAEEVGEVLHLSREAVDRRRAGGGLLAVDIGHRGHLYPSWQFAGEGVLPGLEEILALLAEHPPLARLRFFLSGNHRLGGERPLDRLRRGDLEAVRLAARTFGEHGAA
ncbi:hypothetical protein SOCE26_042710 [Sorangium cellulosum]|uniref:DNA-binding protein n=2 Tax=Sorangium cellulosum TaxID=56 RepID=A0A2L0EU66_SORCE|nr:hypothetical protein SOCE26_042710 [Sorangium cellulosum]